MATEAQDVRSRIRAIATRLAAIVTDIPNSTEEELPRLFAERAALGAEAQTLLARIPAEARRAEVGHLLGVYDSLLRVPGHTRVRSPRRGTLPRA